MVGNPAGRDRPTALYVTIDPEYPDRRNLSWTPAHSDALFRLLIDGNQQTITDETSYDNVPQDAIAAIEIWEAREHTRTEDLSLVATPAGNTILCSWDEVSGDPVTYDLYRSATSGSYTDPPVAVVLAGRSSYVVDDGPLEEGTWYHRLTARDAAGNPVNSNETSTAVSIPPDPPADLAISHDDGTYETTLTWTASPSSDVAGYYLYEGTDTVELTGTPTDLGDVTTHAIDNTGVSGRLQYLLRAYDGDGNEEQNLAQMAEIVLSNGVQSSQPNSPRILAGDPIADGEVELLVEYDRTGESGEATEVRLYVNDGAGGAMDWNTAVGTASLATGLDLQTVTVESSGLTGGLTYVCGVRAATTGGTTDTNTETVSVETDATAPGAPTLSAEVD
jgi:hypothetical protein